MSQSNRGRRPPSRARQQPVEDMELAPARTITLVVVVLASVAVLTSLNEPYSIVKAFVLGLGALALVGLAVWHAAGAGRLRFPDGLAVRLGVAFVALMGVATLVNAHVMQSLLGDYGRSSGWLTYMAAVVLFLAVLRSFTPRTLPWLAHAFIGAGAITVVVGLAQARGAEPLGLHSDLGAVIGTLGQENFVAGFLGIVLPFVVWAFLRPRQPLAQRVALGILGMLSLYVAAEAKSFQVLPAMAVGLLVVLGAELSGRLPGRRLLLAGGATLLVVLVAAAVLHGPLERQIRSGMDERALLWQAGGEMVKHDPITGYGPAGYAEEFTTYRPLEHTKRFGTFQIADTPHNVPLGMFVAGGVLLGGLYLAFVVVVLVALVRGLRRAQGPDRMLLAAFGGAWAAYQVQSLVSIDVPTLLMSHFVLTAAVLVLTGDAPVRERMVAALTPKRAGRTVRTTTAGQVARGVAVLAVLAGLWFISLPVRADIAYRQSRDAKASGQLEGALTSSARAVSLASWNGLYWANQASLLASSGDQAGGLAAGWKAARNNQSSASYALSAGQLAHRMGRDDDADRYFRFALDHSPHLADALNAYAEFLIDRQRFGPAKKYAAQAVDLVPINISFVRSLARAQEGLGQDDQAIATYERLLRLNDRDEGGNQALAQLYDKVGRTVDARRVWEHLLLYYQTNAAARAALGLEA